MANCPFCGSENIQTPTPYIAMGEKFGEYDKQYTFCCQAQRKNYEYASKHFDPSRGDNPSPDEVGKW